MDVTSQGFYWSFQALYKPPLGSSLAFPGSELIMQSAVTVGLTL